MIRRTRHAALVLALTAAAATLPGCMFALGSKIEGGNEERVKKLEERMRKAEERLGIAAPEVTK